MANDDSKNTSENQSTYLLGKHEVTRAEFEHYKETRRFPIRLETVFPDWAERQDSSLSQKEIEERWFQLKDQVHSMLSSFILSQKLGTAHNNDFESYVAGKVIREDQLESAFNQEVRQPVLDYIKAHPNTGQVDLVLDEDGKPDIQAYERRLKNYEDEADDLTLPVEKLTGSHTEMVDHLIDHIKQKMTDQGVDLNVKPEAKAYFVELAEQVGNAADLQRYFRSQVSKLVAECHDDNPDETLLVVQAGGGSVQVVTGDGYHVYGTLFGKVKKTDDK
ncbi:hypothetical protein OZX65_05995 [Leuconostocaceae bacterium ESL0723]|nr:hypothetical protein OZX65_05995 [Leuconostocaceae bacterium ESL0723]